MFYKFLYSDPTFGDGNDVVSEKMLVDLVDDHDRWIHNKKRSKDLCTLHDAFGQDFFIERFVKNISIAFNDTERYIISLENYKKEKFIEEKIKQTQVFSINMEGKKYRVGIIDTHKEQSFLGNSLLEDLKLDLDFVIMTGTRTISFRSKKEKFNVSDLAKKFGGGGHSEAGGCSIKGILGKNLVNLIIDKLKESK